jgi:hypothetical protein
MYAGPLRPKKCLCTLGPFLESMPVLHKVVKRPRDRLCLEKKGKGRKTALNVPELQLRRERRRRSVSLYGPVLYVMKP